MKKEEKVREYYNNFSNNYNDFYKNIQNQKFDFIQYKISIMAESTIDIGGGTGLLSQYLGIKLLTFDISFKMVRIGLKNRIIENGIVGDICFLPFRRNTFETLISFTAIQNTNDFNKSLSEIKRVGEKKCELVITLLEKIIDKTEFSKLLEYNGIKAEVIQFPVEDIGVIITNQI